MNLMKKIKFFIKQNLDLKFQNFYILFFLSLFITAFGQPDRHFSFALLAYLFGYLIIIRLLLEVKSKFRRCSYGFLWALGVQLFQLNWLSTTHYHGFGIVLVYLLVCFLVAFQFSILTFFMKKNGSLNVFRALLIASLWTLMEWSRLFYLCGFPFNNSGLVLTFNPFSLQLASLVGIYGLTFWVLFTASMGAFAWEKKTNLGGGIWISLLAFPFFFGAVHLKMHEKKLQKSQNISVALIQTGLTTEQKWPCPGMEKSFITRINQWERIFAFLREGGKEKFDLIVLPESAVPGEAYKTNISYEAICARLFMQEDKLPPLTHPLAFQKSNGKWMVSHAWVAQAIANLYNSDVIAGLNDYEALEDKNYNSAFYFLFQE